MNINTDYLDRCIETLERAFDLLQDYRPGEIEHDLYRSACVKEFEIIEEQCGSLLKKRLREYFASNREVDELRFKDIFRHAAKHALITGDECERWLHYRDCRNNSAHRYGEDYAEEVLTALPAFITDAKAVSRAIKQPTS